MGYVIDLTSSNLCGPCHIIHRTSKLTRKLVNSYLGGEVYAFSEMSDLMFMLRGFYGHFADLYSGTAGPEDCESLFAHHKKKKMVAEKFSVCRFSAIHQATEIQGLDNVHWILGGASTADGSTQLHSGILPLLRLMELGTYNPRKLRPPKWVDFWGP